MELQRTHPPRKVLHITAEGQAAFAAQQGTSEVAALIARQRSACQGWIKGLQAELQALDHRRPYDRLVLQFRLSQLEAVLPWLDQCEEVLATPATLSLASAQADR